MSGLATLLALGSSVLWGTADFAGGLLSRRLPAVSVAVVSQAAGFVALLVAVAIAAGDLEGRSLWIGVLAGLGGGIGLAAFYKALALGTMSIISPVVACGAVVPFAIAVATGERPSAIAVAGAGLALAGAVLASLEERRDLASDRARAVGLAVVAAIALGLFTYFLGLGSRDGSPLSTLVGARVGSLSILLCLALGMRAPLRIGRRWLLPVAAVGLCDVAANALLAMAATKGLISLVAVLGSLYPVVTVLLALVFLGERLTRVQAAGVGIALTGVVVLSAG
jgi:drug/metabolite transporter (DMT)-like permease